MYDSEFSPTDSCAHVKISHTAVTNSYCSIKERVTYLLTPSLRGLRSFIALRLSSSSVHSSESRWSQSKNVVVERVSLHVILFLSQLFFVNSVHLKFMGVTMKDISCNKRFWFYVPTWYSKCTWWLKVFKSTILIWTVIYTTHTAERNINLISVYTAWERN
jgi:hypothetical protein